MTYRVQRSYCHGWEGKADHLLYLLGCDVLKLSLSFSSKGLTHAADLHGPSSPRHVLRSSSSWALEVPWMVRLYLNL